MLADILFVIDESGPMDGDQQDVRDNVDYIAERVDAFAVLSAPELVDEAFGARVGSLVALIGTVLGARVLAEFGDAPAQTARHARRKLAKKLVKILHGVLHHRQPYDEHIAWHDWLDNTPLQAAD